MENDQFELKFENQRLEQTISIARIQLEQAKNENEKNMETILEAKREMRENSVHSVSGLGSADGFEALVALNQYVNPILTKFDEYEAAENRIERLERLILSPYFARIDFKFDGEDEFEKIYIGRSSLMQDNSCDFIVYDWRSPIASIFYRFLTGPASYEAPMGTIIGAVNLKRQYEIKNGTLQYFFDADVQIVDEFLREMLSQNTSSKMKAIVETIQKEQDIVIRDMESELMIVQGAAGSGKTSIALHRAAYLMYQGLSSKLTAHNIIIISPNTLFEQYISNVLPELGEDRVVSIVFEDILHRLLPNNPIETRNQFLEKVITNSLHGELRKSSIEFKTSHQFLEILNRFMEDLPHKWIDFQDICIDGQCIASKEILRDKIVSGRKTTPLKFKLEMLADFILETAKEFQRESSAKSEYSLVKKEVQKLIELNVEPLYKELFHSKDYFYSLTKGLNLPRNIEDILTFTQENLSTATLYYDDAIALTFLKLKLEGAELYQNIKQVVIDEAQDYYPLQYEIFHLLFPNSKYTILGDINQTLEKQEDLLIYEQIGNILNKRKQSLITLDKSFRCTNEILVFSSKFIPHRMEIKSFNRGGCQPEIHTAIDQMSLCDLIISEAKYCGEKGYQSIGLICKTERNSSCLYESLKDRIDVKLIKNDSDTDLKGMFIIPVYMSKGLEFDAVLLCDANDENYHSEGDKNLLYIACTRALHRLNLFFTGKSSSLLSTQVDTASPKTPC